MILLVSYTLRDPFETYNDLSEELRKADAWWHYLDQTWLLRTTENPEDWCRRLRKHLKKDDALMVVRLEQADVQGYLPERAWSWLEEEFGQQRIKDAV